MLVMRLRQITSLFYSNNQLKTHNQYDWSVKNPIEYTSFRQVFWYSILVPGTWNSRTWDKKIPLEEGFLLFLSSTARGCLVLRVAVWYRLSGTPFLSYCSFTSVIMTSQRKAQRFPQRQRVAVTLKRTLLAYFSLKCISQWGTRKIIKS